MAPKITSNYTKKPVLLVQSIVSIERKKQDFKKNDLLITAWSRVQVLDGPPKFDAWIRFHASFLSFRSLFLIESLAHLAADRILPLVVNLGANGQRGAGLGVTGLRRNGSHANVRVGKQDADKGMPEHMRMNFADTRLFGYPVHNGTVGVQALTKAVCSTPR